MFFGNQMTSRLQAADESIGLLSDRKVIILQHRRDVIFSARMAHAQRFSLRRLTFKVQVLPAYSIFFNFLRIVRLDTPIRLLLVGLMLVQNCPEYPIVITLLYYRRPNTFKAPFGSVRAKLDGVMQQWTNNQIHYFPENGLLIMHKRNKPRWLGLVVH